MDSILTRGGAVALFTLGVALPLGAQGGGAGPVRVRDRDTTVVVRVFDASRQGAARFDSGADARDRRRAVRRRMASSFVRSSSR